MGKRIEWFNADGLRWCSGCQAYMSPDLFHAAGPTASTPDKRSSACKVCESRRRRDRYARIGARERAYARAYRAAHPEYNQTLVAQIAKRGHRLRRSLATGAYQRRIERQARDERDRAIIRQRLAQAQRIGQRVTVNALASELGCSFRRARRLSLAVGGVVTGQRNAREEMAG